MDQNIVRYIGWFASLMAIAMFVSYIDQIRLNIGGHPGSVILSIVTAINCTAWALYGYFKIPRDWPIVLPNALGFMLGIGTLITALAN